MNKSALELFDAVRYTLSNSYYEEPIHDEASFFKLAHENGLSGMIFSILPKEALSETVFNQFKKDFYAYNASDLKQLQLVEKIKEIFNRAEIKHIFLKGVHLKKVYPASYMRSMGDIDILIEDGKFKAIKPLLLNNGFKLTGTSEQHDNYKHESGLEIEVHPKLTRTFKETQQVFFDKAWDYTNQEDQFTYTFDYSFELVYFLNHMAKHFYGSGVGLRTILDIGLYTQKYKDSIDLQLLEKYLEETEYLKFFKTVLYLNKKYFNINPFPTLINEYSLDESYYEMLTKYILSAGVHGTGENFNQFIGRVGFHKMRNESKFTLLRKIIFPNFKDMIGLYPWLKKYPFLLPIAYILRVIKLSIFRFKRSFGKYKQLRSSERDANKVTDLYKKIGL